MASVVELSIISELLIGKPLWEVIDDMQTANWQNIGTTQTPSWSAINTDQAANWAAVTN
jgi:hypothetical protein